MMMHKVAVSLEFSGDMTEYHMLHATFELCTTALSRAAELSGAHISSSREIVLTRLDHAIAQQICNPDLDAATLAQNIGVSIRYVNKLLAESGTSLMRHVKNIRLESCASILRDPTQKFRSVTDIAMQFGFNDMSHFSRAFRDHFDMSPREYRKSGTCMTSEHSDAEI